MRHPMHARSGRLVVAIALLAVGGLGCTVALRRGIDPRTLLAGFGLLFLLVFVPWRLRND